MKKSIFLCSICNISSGSCAEDCGFCTQSAKHSADIERYKYKDIAQIVLEAKTVTSYGALGFCLVTSGLGLDDKKLAFVCETARAVKAELPNIHLIACNGLASVEQLKTLKEAGNVSLVVVDSARSLPSAFFSKRNSSKKLSQLSDCGSFTTCPTESTSLWEWIL